MIDPCQTNPPSLNSPPTRACCRAPSAPGSPRGYSLARSPEAPPARYPADTLERLLAIRAMRDQLHMPLTAIRQELLVASREAVRALAAKAANLAPEATEEPPSAPSSALDYIRGLRTTTANTLCEAPSPLLPPPKGFEALELTLRRDRAARPARRAPRSGCASRSRRTSSLPPAVRPTPRHAPASNAAPT